MAAAGWQRAKEIFQAAVTRVPEARAAYLAEACRDDADLRQDVESLLAAHEKAGEFLSPGLGLDPDLGLETSEPAVGIERIGPYRILDTIAHGGMGTVYRAVRDDDDFRKTVALKLIRGGRGSDFLERRFRQERQILARLQHPNIATVFDGGTSDDGQPYLVMEHVEGRPITEFCAAAGLGTRERLALFQAVCGAVQYAHQNLVIHRDLKPDNILVTPEGVPKLLDFGIAKLLAAGVDPEEAPTATLLPMMTPEYASPEQVRGAPVTTASDVYSLGVLLYELLSGQRPYAIRSESLPDIVRMVCEAEPPLPSKVARRPTAPGAAASLRDTAASELRGDLDTIVMKALHKDPARRYPSAQELATDIRRHLDGLPVLARPDTVGYRASKFVTRHRAGVAAAVLVFVSLVVAVVITTRQARIAQRRFQDTRRLANTLVYDTWDAISNVPGASEARSIVVKHGLEYLDRLSAEAGHDRDLLLELSTAYTKLGDAQGLPDQASLGDSRGALESFHKALVIRERMAAEAPNDFVALYRVGILHHRIGQILRETGDVRGALERHRKGLQIAEEASRGLGGDFAARRRILVAHCHLAATFLLMGQAAETLDHARQGLAIAGQLRKENPKVDSGYDFPVELEADALALQGDTDGALARILSVLENSQQALAADPADASARLDVANNQIKVARLLVALGRAAEAGPRVEDAVRAAEDLVAQDPHDQNGLSTLGLACLSQADLLQRARPARAFELYEKGLVALRKVTTGDPSNLKRQLGLGTLLLHKSEAELAAGRAEAAGKTLAEAEDVAQAIATKDPAMREYQLLLARVRYREGTSLASGSEGQGCARLRDAATIWANLERRGARAPQEAAEQRAVTAAAGACTPGHELVVAKE